MKNKIIEEKILVPDFTQTGGIAARRPTFLRALGSLSWGRGLKDEWASESYGLHLLIHSLLKPQPSPTMTT